MIKCQHQLSMYHWPPPSIRLRTTKRCFVAYLRSTAQWLRNPDLYNSLKIFSYAKPALYTTGDKGLMNMKLNLHSIPRLFFLDNAFNIK